MSKFIDYNPARILAAIGGLGQTVIILIASVGTWAPGVILAVEGVATGVIAVLGSLFVEAKAVSKTALNDYKAAVDAATHG